MLRYKKLYFMLFNFVTDGINALENFDGVKALQILKQTQKRNTPCVIHTTEAWPQSLDGSGLNMLP